MGYFQSKERMQKPETEHEDWMEEAPILASLRGSQPVDPPEGYFDALPAQVMGRIKTETKALDADQPVLRLDPKASGPGGRRAFPRYMSMAAGIAILLAVGLVWISNWGSPKEITDATFAMQLEQLSDDAILEHLSFSDLDEAEVTALIDDDALALLGPEFEEIGPEGMDFLENMDWEDLDLEGLDLGNLEDLNLNFEQEI